MSSATTQDATIHETVQKAYAGWATGNGRVPRDQTRADLIAQAMGYSVEELESLPEGSNMGLSCGNTIQAANLREGEVVVDLGSGGGLDCFLASKKVGATGKVIGIDMTPEMLTLARRNAKRGGYTNVEFVQSFIEDMDLATNTADCVISNCVLNLCPDKPRAFREVLRILKPGGRLVASDIAIKKALPPAIRESLNAYVGCIAGAVLEDDYARMLREAGFAEVRLVRKGVDLNAYNKVVGGEGVSSCCGPAQAAPASSCCGPAQAAPASTCCGPAQAASSCCGPAQAAPASSCCGPAQAAPASMCCGPAQAAASCCGPAQASSCCGPAQPAAASSCCAPAQPAAASSCCTPATTSTAQQAAVQSCCAPPSSVVDLGESMAKMGVDYDPNEYAASYLVFAVKAASSL